jgi:hypothetical protein
MALSTALCGLLISGLPIVDDAVIERFAPVVFLHPDESYFPLSIEGLIEGGTWEDEGRQEPHLQPDDLAHRAGWLRLGPQVYPGQRPGGSGQVEAPMYVGVQQATDDRPWVELHYMALFAYQGPQILRFFGLGPPFSAAIPHFGEHMGDLERLSLRLDPSLQRVVRVEYSAHGHSRVYAADAVYWADGTHPVVHCALHSHGFYNSADPLLEQNLLQHHAQLGAWGLDLVDLTASTGASWAPSGPGALRRLALGARGEPVGAERWAAYRGRLGAPGTNAFSGLGELSSSALSAWQRTWGEQLIKTLLPWLDTERLGTSKPPMGPACRPWMSSP